MYLNFEEATLNGDFGDGLDKLSTVFEKVSTVAQKLQPAINTTISTVQPIAQAIRDRRNPPPTYTTTQIAAPVNWSAYMLPLAVGGLVILAIAMSGKKKRKA